MCSEPTKASYLCGVTASVVSVMHVVWGTLASSTALSCVPWQGEKALVNMKHSRWFQGSWRSNVAWSAGWQPTHASDEFSHICWVPPPQKKMVHFAIYSMKWNLVHCILITVRRKCMHSFPPHPSYVPTQPGWWFGLAATCWSWSTSVHLCRVAHNTMIPYGKWRAVALRCEHNNNIIRYNIIIINIIIIIMEKTEAGLRGLCIREIDVKSQILVHKILQKTTVSDAMEISVIIIKHFLIGPELI